MWIGKMHDLKDAWVNEVHGLNRPIGYKTSVPCRLDAFVLRHLFLLFVIPFCCLPPSCVFECHIISYVIFVSVACYVFYFYCICHYILFGVLPFVM